MDISRFIPARNLETLRRVGLHKIAGAMHGLNEMTLKEGVALSAARTFAMNAENRSVREGLTSLAALRGEKVAEEPWIPLAMRSLGPAALGGLAAYLGSPNDPDAELRNTAAGVGLGGGLGLLNTLRRSFAANPGMANVLGETVTKLK